MKELNNITLIAVACTNIEDTVKALHYSCRKIKFGEVKLVSHEKPENLTENIIFEQCEKIKNINEWNYYMIYNLYKHINTDFCLIIHYDGFIINADRWNDEFLNYDYIGAPWNIKNDSYIDPFGNHIRVGNSVSIRSKKLLNVPNKINIPFEVNIGTFYKHMNADCYNEDGNICVHNRHLFEQQGCKYAPVELAVHFGKEQEVPEAKGIIPFTFHNKSIYKKILENT